MKALKSTPNLLVESKFCWNLPPPGGDIPTGGETVENTKANKPPETIVGLAKARAERPDDAQIKAKLDNCIHSKIKELCENPPIDPQSVESLKGEIQTAMAENPTIAGELNGHIKTIQVMVKDEKGGAAVQVASTDPSIGVSNPPQAKEAGDQKTTDPGIETTTAPAEGNGIYESLNGGESYQVTILKRQAQETTEKISENRDQFESIVKGMKGVSPEARQKIMERVKELEFNPERLTDPEKYRELIINSVQGLSPKEMKSIRENSAFMQALDARFPLIQKRYEIRSKIAKEQAQQEGADSARNLIKEADSEFMKGIINEETYAALVDVNCALHDPAQLITNIDQAITDVSKAKPQFGPDMNTDRHDIIAFNNKRELLLSQLKKAKKRLTELKAIDDDSKRKVEATETVSESVDTEIERIENNDNVRGAYHQIANSEVVKQTGSAGKQVTQFLALPDKQLTPENVERVMKVANDPTFINASEQERENIFAERIGQKLYQEIQEANPKFKNSPDNYQRALSFGKLHGNGNEVTPTEDPEVFNVKIEGQNYHLDTGDNTIIHTDLAESENADYFKVPSDELGSAQFTKEFLTGFMGIGRSKRTAMKQVRAIGGGDWDIILRNAIGLRAFKNLGKLEKIKAFNFGKALRDAKKTPRELFITLLGEDIDSSANQGNAGNSEHFENLKRTNRALKGHPTILNLWQNGGQGVENVFKK